MPGGASSGSPTVISSLPYSDSDTSPGAAGLWYQYVGTAAVNEIGIFVYAAAAATLQVTMYAPDAVTRYPPDDPIDGVHNKPFQIPVDEGVSYYLHVYNAGAYTLSVVAGPSLAVPLGSLFVTDDVAGWPLALLSGTDGSVLRFVHPFPAGESADVIASGSHVGRILVHDRDTDHLQLYSPQIALLADLDYSSTGNPVYPIRSNKVDAFYVGKPIDPTNANHASVTTVTSAGAFGATTWNLPAAGLVGLAPSLDDTVLYFAGQNGTVASPVQCWDLVSDAALPDLVAGIANYRTQDDILVLDDDTIVVSYENNLSQSNAPLVKRYATDGTTLNTYTLTGSLSSDVRLAYALDDPVSFWVWTKLSGGLSRFTNLRASDGATVTTFDVAQYRDGVYEPPETATPSARFGASESCTFLLTRAPVVTVTGGGPGGSPTGTAFTGYVSPPRRRRPCPQ